MHTDWYRTKLLDVACKKCPRSKEVEVYIAYMADDASQPGPNNGHIFPIIYYVDGYLGGKVSRLNNLRSMHF